MKIITIALVSTLMSGSTVFAGSKHLMSCFNFDVGAKIKIFQLDSGVTTYDVVACGDGRQDLNCIVYGDYRVTGKVDLNNPDNTPFVFRDGSVGMIHLFGFYLYRDSDANLSIEFPDANCNYGNQ